MKKALLFLFTIILILSTLIVLNNKTIEEVTYNYIYHEKIIFPEFKKEELAENKTTKQQVEEEQVIKEKNIDTATLTAYTAYCEGCSGITASGYDVRNTSLYFDSEYGNVSIVAADKTIPFGSIIKFYNLLDRQIYAIVLDRGSAIGFNKRSQFDLLISTSDEAISFGVQKNISYEVLRYGY